MEGLLAIIVAVLFSLWVWNLKQEVTDLSKQLAGAAHGKTHGPTGTGEAHHQEAASAGPNSAGNSLKFSTYGDNRVWVIKT